MLQRIDITQTNSLVLLRFDNQKHRQGFEAKAYTYQFHVKLDNFQIKLDNLTGKTDGFEITLNVFQLKVIVLQSRGFLKSLEYLFAEETLG